jgi:hypothetical protein
MPHHSIVRWDGRRVAGARSTGSGVFAALDWRDLVLRPGPGIEAKARVGSRQARAFAPDDLARLVERDGRYCDPQSLRSEDTVTWSVFGPHVPGDVVRAIVSAAFRAGELPGGDWTHRLWHRLPHPDTGHEATGPEADVLSEAPGGWCYAFEAKWLADLSDRQGRGRDRTQLEMRSASVVARGGLMNRRGSIVIVPGPRHYPFAGGASVFARYFTVDRDGYAPRASAVELEARALSWDMVTRIVDEVPGGEEVARYLRWRLSHLNGPGEVAAGPGGSLAEE